MPDRGQAWIVSFGPVGSGADGYILRAELNARALAGLGFDVNVLDVSSQADSRIPWPNVQTHPAWPSMFPRRRLLGSLDVVAIAREQIALVVGLIRKWRSLRSADLLLVEGGLLALAFATRLAEGRRRPVFVFDLITLMSSLHRDPPGRCTLQCKSRRLIWRVLETVCVRFSDLAVAGTTDDAKGLHGERVEVVPHAMVVDPYAGDSTEHPDLVGFLGSGHVIPNRMAVDFIESEVLTHRGLEAVRCRVIGDLEGYGMGRDHRLEFLGFRQNPSQALAPVSVGCAPMEGAGGVSTKVLTYLMNGKRTVCTPEAGRGIAMPVEGLWVAPLNQFADAVTTALAYSWPSSKAATLRDWMSDHHGLGGLTRAWNQVLATYSRITAEASSQ